MKIFTHFVVDLDAVCSVWAAKQFISGAKGATVEFRPANWDGKEMAEGDLALDIDAGGRGMKGEKGENGIVHSCVALIVAEYASPADQSALASLVRFVDAQDAHGSAVKFLAPEASRESQETLAMTGLNAVLRALQATHSRNDALVVERMSEILSGMLQAGRARSRQGRDPRRRQSCHRGELARVRDERRAVRGARGARDRLRGRSQPRAHPTQRRIAADGSPRALRGRRGRGRDERVVRSPGGFPFLPRVAQGPGREPVHGEPADTRRGRRQAPRLIANAPCRVQVQPS